MVAPKAMFRYLNSAKDWPPSFGGTLGGALGEALCGPLGGALGINTVGHEGALSCDVDSDYAGYPDDYKSRRGLVITFGGAVDLISRKQNSTAQSTTDAEYYVFAVGCIRLTQISHHFNEIVIPTIPHLFSNSQSVIASIKNRISRGTAVAHIPTK
jgi:hypothetical protein